MSHRLQINITSPDNDCWGSLDAYVISSNREEALLIVKQITRAWLEAHDLLLRHHAQVKLDKDIESDMLKWIGFVRFAFNEKKGLKGIVRKAAEMPFTSYV